MSDQSVSRRVMLRGAAAAGAGLGAASVTGLDAVAEAPPARGRSMIGVPFEGTAAPRFGIIGLGNRGGGMLPLLLAIPAPGSPRSATSGPSSRGGPPRSSPTPDSPRQRSTPPATTTT